MISMLPTDDVVSLRCDKQKDAEPFASLLLKKVDVPEAESCVVRLAADFENARLRSLVPRPNVCGWHRSNGRRGGSAFARRTGGGSMRLCWMLRRWTPHL
jgi:hypothetical protein